MNHRRIRLKKGALKDRDIGITKDYFIHSRSLVEYSGGRFRLVQTTSAKEKWQV
jgi:hypothetical protein